MYLVGAADVGEAATLLVAAVSSVRRWFRRTAPLEIADLTRRNADHDKLTDAFEQFTTTARADLERG